MNGEDYLWELVFEVLSGDDRLKRFLLLPRHEVIGLMKAHGAAVEMSIFVIFRLVEKGYVLQASRLLLSWGDYRAYAMIMHLVRSVRIWKLESIEMSGRKSLEV